MKKKIFVFGILLLLLVIVFFKNYNNFHVVIDGELYRSAELDSVSLKKYVDKYKIKSIVNLKGNTGSNIYNQEKFFSENRNIELIDFRLWATKMVSIDSMNLLVNIMDTIKKPLLIHCRQGADRTSLGCALYLWSIKKYNYEKSKSMLSIKYGHFPSIFGQTQAMDSSFNNFVRWNNNGN